MALSARLWRLRLWRLLPLRRGAERSVWQPPRTWGGRGSEVTRRPGPSSAGSPSSPSFRVASPSLDTAGLGRRAASALPFASQ